ncbi:MAG: hypothetical protein CM15mP73_1150 [Hyphomicrobiales bacterium]|nr:MAG: hypothetical protein CM15mP73_1150 [Hyphomicrobiales bacterium]
MATVLKRSTSDKWIEPMQETWERYYSAIKIITADPVSLALKNFWPDCLNFSNLVRFCVLFKPQFEVGRRKLLKTEL